MYCEPKVVEPPTLPVKTDLSALGRSTIRRHRTVRDSTHSRDRVSHVDRHSREFDRRSSPNSRGHGHSYLHSRRRGVPVPATVETGVNFARRAALTDLVYPVASQRVGFGQGRRLRTDVAFLRDALHHERPRRRLDGMDTVTELLASSHPALSGAGRRAIVSSDLRYQNATPNMRASTSDVLGHSDPYPELDHSSVAPSLRRSPHASSPYPPIRPVSAGSLTTRFAPAHRFDLMEDISLTEFLLGQGYGMNREVSPDGLPSVVSGERRTPIVPWQENQETPRYSLEGIEHRRRSLSPGHYSHGASLDTMMPDDRLPSLTPSFTSIRALASSFSSHPASYLRTIATVPSMSPLLHVYPTVCESTDSEGSITAEDNEYDVQNSYVVNYRMQNPTNGADPNSRRSRVSLNAAELARHSVLSEPGQELLQIQNNLDRLERNVPLEW